MKKCHVHVLLDASITPADGKENSFDTYESGVRVEFTAFPPIQVHVHVHSSFVSLLSPSSPLFPPPRFVVLLQ